MKLATIYAWDIYPVFVFRQGLELAAVIQQFMRWNLIAWEFSL